MGVRTASLLGAVVLSLAAAAGVVLAAQWSPIVLLIAVVACAGGVLTWLHPVRAAWVLAFLTAAFPKAGIKVGGFPFPVFLFGLALAVFIVVARSRRSGWNPFMPLGFLLFAGWCAGRVVLMAVSGMGPDDYVTFAAWSLVPASFLVIAASGLPDSSVTRGFGSALDRGFMVAAGFGLVQYVFGLEATKVPGLTIAYGDSYADNNLVIFGGPELYTKIPSTYQGGNVYGIVAAFFLVSASARFARRVARPQDVVLLVLALSGVALSGSRTAIAVAALGLGLLFVTRAASWWTRVWVTAAALIGYQAAVIVQPGLASRYSIEDLSESAGAGRLQGWADSWATTPWSHWIFGVTDRPDWTPAEGGPGLVQQLGLLGVLLLLWVIAGALRRCSAWAIPVAAVYASAFVDSAYILFPTLFLPAARVIGSPASRRMGIPRADEETEAGEVGTAPVIARTPGRLGRPSGERVPGGPREVGRG